MKKIILFTVLLIVTVQFTFAQNTIAKLKFEEAEEAYANNNFELTLTKLNEVETLLKATNPKLLHLKILAEDKLIHEPIFNNAPELISQLKTDCNVYLTKYESIENNEDKYREVYKVSEAAKQYKFNEERYNAAVILFLEAANINYNERNFDAFITSYEKIAMQGNLEAIYRLGQFYQYAKTDYANALKWYEKGVNLGGTTCMVSLGNLYKFGGLGFPINTEKAIYYFKMAADLEDLFGIYEMANLYIYGQNVPKNANIALEWFNKGMKIKPKNSMDSTALGVMYCSICKMYFEGEAINKNYLKVDEYANIGIKITLDDEAGQLMTFLGDIYKAGGYGVTLDFVKAFYYYEGAASKSDYMGAIKLAEMYQDGLGTKKNRKAAQDLMVQVIPGLEQNANGGVWQYSIKLAEIYEKGIGVDQNLQLANEWRAKAEKQKETK